MKQRSLTDLLTFADNSIDTYQQAVDRLKAVRAVNTFATSDTPPSISEQTTIVCMDAYTNVVAGFRAIRLALERLQVDEEVDAAADHDEG